MEETEESLQDRQKSEIDNYTGISIKVSSHVTLKMHKLICQVSFNSKADEGQRIQQLSGGQKSLVALATGRRDDFQETGRWS